ncbi:hypothetical protein ABI59_04765 [Acidobacteria bacterium Mor1]|nr:hypothetical protein ABI59_04765 [Acidobacteria bacterium Mor1]
MRLGEPNEFLEVLDLEDYLLLAAVCILPWLLGGVSMWAYRPVAFLLVTGAGLALIRDGWNGLGLGGGRSRWLLPAFLLLGWALFQQVPLPAGLIGTLSPSAHALYERSVPGYSEPVDDAIAWLEEDSVERVAELDVQDGGAVFEPPAEGWWEGARTLSVRPDATRERAFWFLALLLGFMTIGQRLQHPQRHTVYRYVLFGLFSALAAFGLLQAATWNGKIFWRIPTPEGNPFGPYVNPVNFAAVMEMAVPWMAGYVIALARSQRREELWRGRVPILAGGVVLCTLAGIVAASKGATVLMLGALAVVAFAAARSWKGRLVMLLVLVLMVPLVVWGISLTPLGERFEDFVDSEGGTLLLAGSRVTTWNVATDIFADYPVTGSGFGTFRELFPAYVPPGSFKIWNQVHNDYLELLIEGGVVAGALTLILLALFGWRAIRAVRDGERMRIERLGLALGILCLAIHAVGDFNHQIPANALLFVTLCAALLGRPGRAV